MQNELAVMDHTGDTKCMWDPNIQAEVENAKSTFDNLKKKGYIAYRCNAQGDKSEIMTAFDPIAGKIIMSPPLIGG